MNTHISDQIQIITHSERVETLFDPLKEVVGQDFASYRGHVYRVITYAMHFLSNDEALRPIIETAFVYHDIGLWKEKNLAYLEPSEAMALADNDKHGWGFDPQLLRNIIHWHHKVTRYRGPNERVIDSARKADWIDASGGLRRMGLTTRQVKSVEDAIPSFGFADVLQRLAGDLGGNRLAGNLKVLRHVFKW